MLEFITQNIHIIGGAVFLVLSLSASIVLANMVSLGKPDD